MLEGLSRVEGGLDGHLARVGLAALHHGARVARPVHKEEVVAAEAACTEAHSNEGKGHVTLW